MLGRMGATFKQCDAHGRPGHVQHCAISGPSIFFWETSQQSYPSQWDHQVSNDQRWQLIHDPEFVAGKPLRKQNLEKELREKQDLFINVTYLHSSVHVSCSEHSAACAMTQHNREVYKCLWYWGAFGSRKIRMVAEPSDPDCTAFWWGLRRWQDPTTT